MTIATAFTGLVGCEVPVQQAVNLNGKIDP